MAIIPSQRHLFDIPDEIAYFNIAYYSPLLNESAERLRAAAAAKSHPWERMSAHFFEDAETIRTLASSIFGGDANGYAVVPSVSYGVSTAARAMEPLLKSGDRIMVIAEEFPSDVFPWMRVAQETGATLVTVPYPERETWSEAVLASMDKHVKVVSISTCHWTNGACIDLVAIAKACREAGSMLVVDATQTLGAMPLPLTASSGLPVPQEQVAAVSLWLQPALRLRALAQRPPHGRSMAGAQQRGRLHLACQLFGCLYARSAQVRRWREMHRLAARRNSRAGTAQGMGRREHR